MNKCELFENIAADVWDSISRNNRRGNLLTEEGITRQSIIDSIQNYVEDRRTFEVFAQKAKDEVNTGGDLELYIEVGYQRFARVFLQAKTMKLDNSFEDLNRDSGSSGRKQYDSLKEYIKRTRSLGYYIFYNGIPGFTKNYIDCKGDHTEKQFGCSIISIKTIEDFCKKNPSGKMIMNFENGPIGTAWRFLTCCDFTKNNDIALYTKDQIDMDPHFEDIFTERYSNFVTQSSINRPPPLLERINNSLHNDGWQPQGRILMTKNSRMKNEHGLLQLEFKTR